MNLRQLEILRSVMRCRTTVRAAEELGMSQSSVSNAIKHIETVLGFTLFERIRNRLVPTEEAKVLLEEAEPLFMHQRAVEQKAVDLKAGRVGRVRLVATAEPSESLLPAVMRRFLTDHPSVFMSLDTRPLETVLDVVENGLADIGFAMEGHERQGLEFKPVADLSAVCVCREESPLAALPVVTPSDLQNEKLIGPQADYRIGLLTAQAFKKESVAYSPTVEVRFLNVAARLVQEGWGVAILDEITASSGRYRDLVIRPFQPSVTFALSMVLPKEKATSILARDFMSAFEKEVRRRVQELRSNGLILAV